MKKLLSVLLLVLLLFNISGLDAYAKSYTVENAYFDVEILSNGDVNVTENWTVNFDGDYSRFYKSLPPKNISKAEKYEDVCINWATINGKECTLNGNLNNRKDYTFNSSVNSAISTAVSPLNGITPASISYIIIPNEYMSLLIVLPLPDACSGGK